MRKQLALALLTVLVELTLISAGLAFTQAIPAQSMSSPVIVATPTPTPVPTSPPTPTPSPTPIPNVSLDYEEISQTAEGNDTVVSLRVTATYNFGETMTYNFQNFKLEIRTSRGGLEPFPIYLLTGTAKPFESGSVTVSSSNTHAFFTLTFRFSTIQSSFGGYIHFAFYDLVYNSNAVSSSTPEPTVPPNPTGTFQPTPSSTPESSNPPSSPPTTVPTAQSGVNLPALQLDWLMIAGFAVLGVVVGALVVFIVLLRRRIRRLERKQNGN